jgi:type IV secretion system protein VirD4
MPTFAGPDHWRESRADWTGRTMVSQSSRGIYLGAGPQGWAWSGPERSVLVLGPSRSGKTTSLIIPNVLAAPGAVVSTSTKPDVLWATAPARQSQGATLLYDPSGSVEPPPGVVRVGWSPVNGSDDWERAMLTADSMIRANNRLGSPSNGDEHWSERATSLLGPLLHAAALNRQPMATVVHWVDRHDGTDALSILVDQVGDAAPPTDVLAGILSTDAREQSGIWSTTSGALGAYRSRAALSSTEPPFFDATAFCEGPNTLYICATGRRQQLLAPLVVGAMVEVRDAAYQRAAVGTREPPVLAALDEVANIAPIPDLPAMVSEGAGQGLLTLACLQDLSQARARWGRQGEAFPSLFATTVVLGGLGDVATLEAISALAGDHEVASKTVGLSKGRDGRLQRSSSLSGVLRRRLSVDALARGIPGHAFLLDAGKRAGWVALTPAHQPGPWQRALDGSRAFTDAAIRSVPPPPRGLER